jgi:hypothetical protein
MPRIHADVERELCIVRELLTKSSQLGVHLERNVQGSFGIVLVRDGGTEESK